MDEAIRKFIESLSKVKFARPEIIGSAGAILGLLYEKGLSLEDQKSALVLALKWLQEISEGSQNETAGSQEKT